MELGIEELDASLFEEKKALMEMPPIFTFASKIGSEYWIWMEVQSQQIHSQGTCGICMATESNAIFTIGGDARVTEFG